MVCCCSQEILGYHFTIVHRSKNIMVDVDSLTRSFGHLVSHHIVIAALLSYRDRSMCPCAYEVTKFSNLGNVNITETDNPSSNPPPFLTSDVIRRFSQDRTTHSSAASSLDPASLPFITTLTIHMSPSPNLSTILLLHNSVTPNAAMNAFQISQSLEIRCLCINDVVGSYTNWGRLHGNRTISWSLQNLFIYPTFSSLFNILHPSNTHIMQTLQDFNPYPTSYIHTTHTINAFFVKNDNAFVASWIQDITSVLSDAILNINLFQHATIWIPRTRPPISFIYLCLDIIPHYLPTS